MLTLQKNKQNIKIANMVQNKKKIPIFWHPTIKDDLMNNVADLRSFNDTYFRDRFELSKEQADDIFTGLRESMVVEKHQRM